ncbi:MmyB family transcriptional regulator [Streptomyces sp. P9-A4]|uniref:MmyB family transcriptional regulator n=1 Tax=Streptomyces sp. P9-A4 TaxID=3072285 RepID=UPI002FC7E5B7
MVHPAGEGPHQRRVRRGARRGRRRAAAGRGRAHLPVRPGSGRPARPPSRRRDVEVPPRVHRLLDSITMSAAFVRNGRLDVIAHNALGRALHAPMFDSPTTDKRGRPTFARDHFPDGGSRDFFVDWDSGAAATVALLCSEAGR